MPAPVTYRTYPLPLAPLVIRGYSRQPSGDIFFAQNLVVIMSDTHVSMKRLGLKLLLVAFLGLLLMATSKIAQAQTETILYAFCSEPNCADGISPNGDLVIDA